MMYAFIPLGDEIVPRLIHKCLHTLSPYRARKYSKKRKLTAPLCRVEFGESGTCTGQTRKDLFILAYIKKEEKKKGFSPKLYFNQSSCHLPVYLWV